MGSSRFLAGAFLLCLPLVPLLAQRDLAGPAQIELALRRLDTVGSVLMIAAHPDDENTALLAYFARGRMVRTGYLSLTRGEGGQNLIGPEQGDLLGIIRTQELLAARRIDGAEQFFTRAIDFGFTKTADETFTKWGRERILSDIVWNIRRFRPDVIILRFSGTPRDGHGQHQASAILGKEAFFAAADPSRFPEQLKYYPAWQAKRLMFNMFSFSSEQEREAAATAGRVEIDAGKYSPILGYSFGEIAGMSRSMHRSQGMGAPQRKGSMKNYLVTVAGPPAAEDIFDGIDTTWNRLAGGGAVGVILGQAVSACQPGHPERVIPFLLKARPLIAAMQDRRAEQKLEELDEAVALASGLWVDATADRWSVVAGGSLRVTATALARMEVPAELTGITVEGLSGALPAPAKPGLLRVNQPESAAVNVSVPADQPISQPYWLREPKQGDTYTVDQQTLVGLPENPPLLRARFRVAFGDQVIELVRPVRYRYVDRVRGELTRAIVVAPPVAVALSEHALIFGDGETKNIEVSLRAEEPGRSGDVVVELPSGWRTAPESQSFRAQEAGDEAEARFAITPPAQSGAGALRVKAHEGGKDVAVGMTVIDYPHIPPQTVFPRAEAKLVRAGIRTLAKKLGYVMGAGDEVPEALRQIGCEVTLLSEGDLARGNLSQFDAIVTGVRAYNVRADLRANEGRLLDYARGGGTVVVQYNVLEGGYTGGNPNSLDHIGPYPIHISRERVTVEESPVRFPNPGSALLKTPNAIGERDFDGWVQERGLYFASSWDPRYQTLLESHDPGEAWLAGGTLYTRYGKGAYVFTAYSWFRELPAGVPGAFRIFANLLSAGKTLP